MKSLDPAGRIEKTAGSTKATGSARELFFWSLKMLEPNRLLAGGILMKSQRSRFMLTLAVGLICLVPAMSLALTPYTQDFENLIQPLPSALADDGWLVFGNVFNDDGSYAYGYGAFPAPNNGLAFCQIDVGQGGPDQGLQQLSVFNDYENQTAHESGQLVESNVFQEQVIGPADIGQRWVFQFQHKMGNLAGDSTALAFIKTLDPGNGYALTNFLSLDMTSIPADWGGSYIVIEIDASLDGQILQIGFSNTASYYDPSGVYYDNVIWTENYTSGVPNGAIALGATLGQNYPNPFNPLTRIDFALEAAGSVDITVFDIAGRRVANLQHGELGVGDHFVTWNGMTDSGQPAAAGQYRYVLKTSAGQVSRSMILLK
jgi:hypothetical protein